MRVLPLRVLSVAADTKNRAFKMKKRSSWRRLMLFALVFMSLQIVANAQSSQIDPNEFYKFPFSVGIQVQYLSPLKDYEVEVNSAIDAAAIVRYPLPFFPKLQPLLRTGIMSFDFTDENVLNPD